VSGSCAEVKLLILFALDSKLIVALCQAVSSKQFQKIMNCIMQREVIYLFLVYLLIGTYGYVVDWSTGLQAGRLQVQLTYFF
jgi:TctA family transporter